MLGIPKPRVGTEIADQEMSAHTAAGLPSAVGRESVNLPWLEGQPTWVGRPRFGPKPILPFWTLKPQQIIRETEIFARVEQRSLTALFASPGHLTYWENLVRDRQLNLWRPVHETIKYHIRRRINYCLLWLEDRGTSWCGKLVEVHTGKIVWLISPQPQTSFSHWKL